MAFDPSKPFTVEEQTVAVQPTAESTSQSTVEPTVGSATEGTSPSVGFDPNKPFTVEQAPRYEDTIFGYTDDEQKKLLEDPSVMDYVVAYGGEISIGEGGKLISTGVGTGLGGPGVGSGLGYVFGGLYFGYKGSQFRQETLRPGEPYNGGELVSDAIINLIPGVGGKGKKLQKIAGAAATGMTANTIYTTIEEGRLPTLNELGQAGLSASVLALGFDMGTDVFRKTYEKYGGLPSGKLTEAFKNGDEDAVKLLNGMEMQAKKYQLATRRNYSELIDNIREFTDDQYIKARVLQDQSGGGQYVTKFEEGKPLFKVTGDVDDYYQNRRVANGVIDAKADQSIELFKLDNFKVRQYTEQFNNFNRSKLSPEELVNYKPIEFNQINKSITDYMYAKHAIDFNKQNLKKFGKDGASGMSTEDAKRIVNQFEGSKKNEFFSEILEGRKKLSNMTLDALVEGGLVSESVAKKLRETYPNYVPLSNVIDGDPMDISNALFNKSNSKFEPKSSGLKTATGGENITDINFNMLNVYNQAIKRAEINKANQSFLKLIENPDNFEAKAKYFTDVRNAKITGKGTDGKPIYSDSNNILTVFEKGKRKELVFRDKELAAVFKGLNTEDVNPALKIMLSAQSFVGSLYTRWNPDFIAPNILRDRSEAFVNNLSKMGGFNALKTILPNKVVEDLNVVRRNIYSPNKLQRDANGLLTNQNDIMYQRFKEAGGSTGGLGVSTFERLEKQISALQDPKMNPNTRIKKLFEFVSNLSEVSEDATRFSTFKNGIDSGMSDKAAALAARDSSFDPKLMGTGGPMIKAAYLFSNPAIQGGKNFIRSMRKPKTMGIVVGTLVSTEILLNQYNSSIDSEWKSKVPEHVRDRGFVVVTGKKPNEDGLNYTTLPIGYSFVPLKSAVNLGVDAMNGNAEISDVDNVVKKLAGKTINAYNPASESLVPTLIEPWVGIMVSNKDGLGRSIRPEMMEKLNINETEKVYDWTAKTFGGELSMQLADSLSRSGMEVNPENLQYLFETYTGGPGRTYSSLWNVASKMYNGEWGEIKTKEMPVVRRFFGETYDYGEAASIRTEDLDLINPIDKSVNTELYRLRRLGRSAATEVSEIKNFKKRRDATISYLSDMSNDPTSVDSFVKKLTKINDTTPALAKELKKPKYTMETKMRFIDAKIQSLPTIKEQQEFLNTMTKYKVITRDNIKRFSRDKETEAAFEAFRQTLGK